MTEPAELLRRIERRALIVAVAGVVLAWLVPRGGLGLAEAVAGGALISGGSYVAIKRGVTGMADSILAGDGRPAGGFSARRLIGFILRYALLAGIAYVMIARLRLSPLGLLLGASVIPVATAAELVRRRS
jgi:hypothetical protein